MDVSDTGRRPAGKSIVVIAVVAGAVVLGAAALVTVMLQPSAITRAGESCSGTKPLDSIFDANSADQSPDSESTTDPEAAGEFDDLFDGVISVEDGGDTLIINTRSTEDDPIGITSLALDCVYEQLEVPSHITERISATRSLDGRQDGAWGDYIASWNYHPDSGANVIFIHD